MRPFLAVVAFPFVLPAVAQQTDTMAELQRPSNRYLAALRKADKTALEQILHKDYQIRFNPLFEEGTRGEYLQEFGDPQYAFAVLDQHRVRFRIFLARRPLKRDLSPGEDQARIGANCLTRGPGSTITKVGSSSMSISSEAVAAVR
jgi:hypothetical protein